MLLEVYLNWHLLPQKAVARSCWAYLGSLELRKRPPARKNIAFVASRKSARLNSILLRGPFTFARPPTPTAPQSARLASERQECLCETGVFVVGLLDKKQNTDKQTPPPVFPVPARKTKPSAPRVARRCGAAAGSRGDPRGAQRPWQPVGCIQLHGPCCRRAAGRARLPCMRLRACGQSRSCLRSRVLAFTCIRLTGVHLCAGLCLSVWSGLSGCVFVCLAVSLSVCESVCVCLCVCVCACLHVWLPVSVCVSVPVCRNWERF